MIKRIIFLLFIIVGAANISLCQHESSSDTSAMMHATEAHADAGHAESHDFDPAATAIHHISDGNVYSILDWLRIPLPMILYAKDKGWDVFMSSKFAPGHHEDGHMAFNGYVMHHGSVHRITDPTFPTGEQHIEGYSHKTIQKDGKAYEVKYAMVAGKEFALEERSTLDGGILGGGITSFYDFSITKNVLSMIIVCLLLFWILRKTLATYRNNPDKAPKGVAAFIEPIFLFIRDEVAIPFIGKDKYKKYFSLLLSIFFFILGLNLFGQVPFFGSTNVTGNITVTMILSIIVFLIVNFSGNKDYWKHILWMPGVPTAIKPLLTMVEVASVFIKPLTLMLRLAGNISAGHIAILSFISLIFVFSNSGESIGGGMVGTAMAVPLTLFMMAIELLVAFLQAYVFTLLTAAYIGSATEEHDHH